MVLCIGFVEIHKQCARSSADRVLGYEPIGRRFESSRARHEKSDCILQSLFSVIFISRREVLLCRDIRLCRVLFASRVQTANIISLSQRHSINIVFIDLCILSFVTVDPCDTLKRISFIALCASTALSSAISVAVSYTHLTLPTTPYV